MPRKIVSIAFLISSTAPVLLPASFFLEELQKGASTLRSTPVEASSPVSGRPPLVSDESLQLQLSLLKKASERKLATRAPVNPLREKVLSQLKKTTPHRTRTGSGIKLMEHQRFSAFKQVLSEMNTLPKPDSEEEEHALKTANEGYMSQAVLRYTEALKDYLEKCRTALSPLSPSDLAFIRSENLTFKEQVAESFREIATNFKSKKTSQQYTQRDLLEGTLTSSQVKEDMERLVSREMDLPEAQDYIRRRKESEIEKIVSGKVKILFDQKKEKWKSVFEQLTSRSAPLAFELETVKEEYNREAHLIEARKRISEHFKESRVKGSKEISLLTFSWREATELDKALILGARALEKSEETRDRRLFEQLLALMDEELKAAKLSFPEKADEKTIRALAPKIQAYIEERIRNFVAMGLFVRFSPKEGLHRFTPLSKLSEIPESFEIGFSVRLPQPMYYGEALYVSTCSALSKPWMSYPARLHTSVEASSTTYLDQGDLERAKPHFHFKDRPIYLLEGFPPQETIGEIQRRVLEMRGSKDRKEGSKHF